MIKTKKWKLKAQRDEIRPVCRPRCDYFDLSYGGHYNPGRDSQARRHGALDRYRG